MSKTIVVVGFGPGVSTAVAEKFGAEGFSVALVARSAARLAAGVEALRAKGVKAAAFPADAGDPLAIRAAIAKARAELGPIGVLHWNAFGGRGLGWVEDTIVAEEAGVASYSLACLWGVGADIVAEAICEYGSEKLKKESGVQPLSFSFWACPISAAVGSAARSSELSGEAGR